MGRRHGERGLIVFLTLRVKSSQFYLNSHRYYRGDYFLQVGHEYPRLR